MFDEAFRIGMIFMVLCSQLLLFPPVYVFWHHILRPLKLVSSRLYWKIDSVLYECMIIIVSSWTDQAGHSLVECGEDVSTYTDKTCILMANHQYPSDIGIIMRALSTKKCVFQRTMWIMDWVLQFANFGWVSKGHGDFFLLQPVDAKKFSLFGSTYFSNILLGQENLLTKSLIQNFHKSERNMKWVILFPEGGFLSNRLPGSQRYSKKNDLPILNHVAMPRLGALNVVANVFNSKDVGTNNDDIAIKWDYIIDMTIGYKKPINPVQHMLRYNYEKSVITMHYRTFKFTDVMRSDGDTFEEKLKNWTYERFYEKEKLLEHFHEHGHFPDQHSTFHHTTGILGLKYWGIHLFCLASWLLMKLLVVEVLLFIL